MNDELIGTEWEDRDPRESGRVVRIESVVDGLDDGSGGPVYCAVTIANGDTTKIGRHTQIGLLGLKRRWRRRA